MSTAPITPEFVNELIHRVRWMALQTHRVDSCIYTVSLLERAIADLARTPCVDPSSVPVMTPLPVYVLALNPITALYHRQYGCLPKTHQEAMTLRHQGGWMVALTQVPGNENDPSRFPGHLVLGLDFGQSGLWIADPSLDQASRPERGIPLGPIMFPVDIPSWDAWESSVLDDDSGIRLEYEKMKNPPSWEGSPDWAKGKEREVVQVQVSV